MDFFSFFFISLSLFLLIISILRLAPRRRRPLRLPPGPPGWPVVGNLFQVANSGKPFFKYIRDLVPKYGPIFTLNMGSRTMIVVAGAELAYEALIVKGQVFADRPRETPTRAVFSCNKFTVNASRYGRVWRSLRKNMVQNGLSSTRLKEYKRVRDDAMDNLVEKFRVEAEGNNGVVSVLKTARFAVFSILLNMCFGVELNEDMIEKIDRMMKIVLVTLDPRIDDMLPILSPFYSKKISYAMDVRNQQIKLILPLIEKRRSMIRVGLESDPTAAQFSYLDTLFDVRIEGRESGPTDHELVTLTSEYLNGGTDTTATAVEWAVGRLIENPLTQTRIHDEIRDVVGSRPVKEEDIENLPYLIAFVKELLRKHPPTHFSLTHTVSEPATLGGYDIPPGCNVEFFLPAISEDPKLWSDPTTFDPDRFVSGKEDADITGVTGVKMIPFGAGRRICPGLSMATIHVHLMIARMVQEFEWGSFPEGSEVDFSEKLEFTVVMKNPLKAKIKKRIIN